MKSVSDGLDSISVSQSIISLRSSTPLIYLLLLSSFPLLCVTTPLQSATTPLQSVVLSKLGLTTPPALTTPSLPVPEHFWDVYRKVEEGMLDEDSIRLFYPQELIDLNSGLLLSYNLSIEAQQAQKEKVVEARVKLRVRGGRGGQLRIYRVEDLSRLRVERLLDSVEIQEEEEQLLDLDVTEGVPYSNQRHTVKLLVVFPIGCSLAESPSNSLSSISQSRAASASMVVGYVDRQGDEEMEEENEHPKRRKRSASEEERRRKERKERRRKNRKHRNGGEKGICHRKPMYVDFAELNWQDWIMAPPGYEAYQCSGGCPFPFPAQVNASNHAIVQGLLHNYNDEIPEPCCVPTETAPLSILYMDVNSRVVIKQYPDMIVTACGCR